MTLFIQFFPISVTSQFSHNMYVQEMLANNVIKNYKSIKFGVFSVTYNEWVKCKMDVPWESKKASVWILWH